MRIQFALYDANQRMLSTLASTVSSSASMLVAFARATAPSHAQTTSDLFNEAVQALEITIHSRDWESLRVNFTSNDFYPVDVTWNGIRVRNVGIRSRGLGSRNGVKPGLEVNFAHYSSRGQFLGMRALVLDNLVTDPSMIRERVAMAFLRRLGVAAPREVHAQLYVNGQYLGALCDRRADRLGLPAADARRERRNALRVSLAAAVFRDVHRREPRSVSSRCSSRGRREHQSTFDLYDPIRELFRTINSAPAASFRDAVSARLDIESTLRLIAGESFLAEWDGILGYAGMNNFYLYHPGSSTQARIFPWDADHTFHAADYPLLAGAAENVLMRRMLEDPVLRARYFQLVNEADRRRHVRRLAGT